MAFAHYVGDARGIFAAPCTRALASLRKYALWAPLSVVVSATPVDVRASQPLPLRTVWYAMLCDAADTYCKAAIRVVYTFPRGARLPEKIPVECFADVMTEHASAKLNAVVRHTASTFSIPSQGMIDQRVEVGLPVSGDVTSVELKRVGCVAQFD